MLSLRPEQPADREFLCTLYASTREEELAPVPWPPEQKAQFLRWQFDLQFKQYHEHYPTAVFHIVQWEGQPIGRLYVEPKDDVVHIIDISLVSTHRGRGIGATLLKQVMHDAATRGVATRIHVEHMNPALRLYNRLGFKELRQDGIYLLMEAQPNAAS